MTGWAKANEGASHPRQTPTRMLRKCFMFIMSFLCSGDAHLGFNLTLVCLALERNQRGQHASGTHLEHRATAIRTAIRRCAIEIAITALHQRGLWTVAICPVEG